MTHVRLAVLDIGSNTVHLLVVDAHAGAPPIPATSQKEVLKLAEYLQEDGSIAADGESRLTEFVKKAIAVAEDQGAEDVMAFATSAIREAPNGDVVLDRIEKSTGVRLRVLSGDDEARLTFLAVRRWLGWSAGNILLLDIGGGSLELAQGTDEYPAAALSVPLGAGRMHSRFFDDRERPDPESIAALRKHSRAVLGRVAGQLTRVGRPDRAVASSKTFRSLARLAGAAPSADGIYVPRLLHRRDLPGIIDTLASKTVAERAELPGISAARAGQVLAGAMVAEAACTVLGIDTLQISPWALREGLIMRRIDLLDVEDDAPEH